MDLHFILQVFKVIELKLGPQLKDLIIALSGRLLNVATPLHTNLASHVKFWNKISCFISSWSPIWSCLRKKKKVPNSLWMVTQWHVITVFTRLTDCSVKAAWSSVDWSLMSKTNAFLVWDISTIVAHPGRSAYWWGCRGALSSQLGQRKSHHISNFSSAEVVTVVATKITVVSDEHQNCVGGGEKNLS